MINEKLAWASTEIALACECEKEKKILRDGDADVDSEGVIACYKGALQIYKQLCRIADSSNASFEGITKILNRLIKHVPVAPIEDIKYIWNTCDDLDDIKGKDIVEIYQCIRMSSLFKYVYADGHVEYYDVNRNYICVDIHTNTKYTCGLVQRIIDKMFPITMPYYPETEPIKIYCEDFLVDKHNGDFDTKGIFYAIFPNGVKIDINRFFKTLPHGNDEISYDEYINEKHKINRG